MCEGLVLLSSPPVLAGLLGRELDTNALHGPIPDALGQLTQLTYLYLYNNKLTSTISSSIGELKKLKTL